MIKLVLFLALLAAAAFGFSHLADTPGHMLLRWGDTEYRVSLVTGLVGLVGIAILVMLVWTVLRLIFRLPSLLSIASRVRRQARGQQAVARGLVAVGAGETKLALRYAAESQRLLGNEPLSLLLNAQAAQLAGNAKGAEAAFRTMLEKPETQSLGLRGLYIEAERRSDGNEARLLAEEALRRAPESAWASEAVLGFKAAGHDWRGAIALVDQNISRRMIDREEGRRQRANLLAAAAVEAREAHPEEAHSLAQEALRFAPNLVPAAEIAARRLAAKGDYAKATRILEAAWKLNPHPDLASAYLAVRHGDSALDKLKRARTLFKLQPEARESRFALARAAIDAREFAAAREALEALALEKPTARACLLMAELEEVESGNQGLVRAWLARASRAPRDPAWVADGVVSETWHAVSPITGRIGAFEWREPPQASEQGLRARIDADRFENPPPPPEAPLIEIASAPAPQLEAQINAESASSAAAAMPDASPAPALEGKPVINDLPNEFRPIIPDDPGPEPTGTKPRTGFRFFG